MEFVDQLLDDHGYSEIANIFNERGFRPGASARLGREAERFTAKRVAYLMHTYRLRSRYDRLRKQGMLSRKEMAARLGITEPTVERWAKFRIIKSHLYNENGWQLYEVPGPNVPAKDSSRWDQLVDRAAAMPQESQLAAIEPKEV